MMKQEEQKQALDLFNVTKRVCCRHYIGYLHCPYEYSSCNKCLNFK